MEKYRLVIPEQVKTQLKEAIGRFDTFLSVLDMMINNGVNVDKLKKSVVDFKSAGSALINEIEKLG